MPQIFLLNHLTEMMDLAINTVSKHYASGLTTPPDGVNSTPRGDGVNSTPRGKVSPLLAGGWVFRPRRLRRHSSGPHQGVWCGRWATRLLPVPCHGRQVAGRVG